MIVGILKSSWSLNSQPWKVVPREWQVGMDHEPWTLCPQTFALFQLSPLPRVETQRTKSSTDGSREVVVHTELVGIHICPPYIWMRTASSFMALRSRYTVFLTKGPSHSNLPGIQHWLINLQLITHSCQRNGASQPQRGSSEVPAHGHLRGQCFRGYCGLKVTCPLGGRKAHTRETDSFVRLSEMH